MVTEVVRVNIRNGIHLRLAGEIVKAANLFKSEVTISKDSMEVNAKSILGVAGLGAVYGTELTIGATGMDEREAVAHLVEMFRSNFAGKER
jgi:phosphotransferase system HPr (HPr) family protein